MPDTTTQPDLPPAGTQEVPPPRAADGKNAAPLEPEVDLDVEADELCSILEKSFRKAYEASGNMPEASQMTELRGHCAMIRDLVSRAQEQGLASADQAEMLKAAHVERDKLKDALTRSKADFLNYQDRTSKDLAKAEEGALRSYVSELLPVLDNLQLSLTDAHAPGADLERVRTALEMIADGLQQTLRVRGLDQIDAAGKPFDPIYHESIASRPADASKGEKPNHVGDVCRAGYTWKGKVLRPAQVLITK